MAIGRTVFAERGFAATSVEEIAGRARVSKPLIYEHFGGKEGLYEVVIDREMDRLLAMIGEALDGADHPRSAVERAADAFLLYIETEREGFRVLVRDAPFGISRGSLPGVLGEVASRAEAILASEFAGRGFEISTAPLFARALVGMVALVGEWWLGVGEPTREEVAAHLTSLAWGGLRGLELEPAPREAEPGTVELGATQLGATQPGATQPGRA